MRRVAAVAMSALAAAAVVVWPGRNAAEPPAKPKTMASFELPDQSGAVRKLADYSNRKALLVIFTGTQCPQANRFLPEIEKIARTYGERGVAVLAVNANRNEQEEIEAHAKENGISYPVLKDAEHALADAMAIEVTPTALVVDASGAVRYRGRIDRTEMGFASTGEDVRAALDAVLEGREVERPETEVLGCTVRRSAPAKTGDVTWTKHVAPIVHANCVQCHRAGQIGPMPLTDYAHASAFATEIRNAVVARRMPPWKPVRGLPMHGERKLTAEQIDTIEKWADSGAPEGDPKDEPALPEFRSDWLLGTPDMILNAGEDFEVRAGPDLYWHFVMPNSWDEDKWVTACEIRPGNARIVHHVLAYLDEMGMAKRLDEQDDALGYEGSGAFPGFVPTGEMGGWTPGFFAQPLPKGVARKLPKNATLVLQVHYNNPTGKAQKDRTQIGLWFAKEPVKQRLYQARIVNPLFRIPPGARRHAVEAAWPVHRDVTVISVMPHAHLIAKTAKMVARLPNGNEVPLVEIDDWDFKWQDTYHLQEPLRLKDGSRVTLTFEYDNSEDNPRNPFSPPRAIRWGENTSDEMCLGYVNYVRNREDLTKPKDKK
jgi:peroxiredoxin